MKRELNREDGYVLPYVLVVFLVLSFVAVSICGISLNHFRAQQAYVAQTRARYEAEGLVEQIVAQLGALEGGSTACPDSEEAGEAAAMDFWSRADALDRAGVSVDMEAEADLTEEKNRLTITAVSTDGTVKVNAELEIDLTTTAEEVVPEEFAGHAAAESVQYVSYHISYPAGNGGGAE